MHGFGAPEVELAPFGPYARITDDSSSASVFPVLTGHWLLRAFADAEQEAAFRVFHFRGTFAVHVAALGVICAACMAACVPSAAPARKLGATTAAGAIGTLLHDDCGRMCPHRGSRASTANMPTATAW